MNIRQDFISVNDYLQRLLKYAEVFQENNFKHWPHLKNKEDFQLIYDLSFEERTPLEEIYSVGRDCAIYMADRLQSFNQASEHPTLKAFVDSFSRSWVYQLNDLQHISNKAKNKVKSLKHCPWAVEQMIDLFDNQLQILVATKSTLELLKQTQLYKMENRKCLGINFQFFSKIWHDPVWSKVIAAALIAIISGGGGYLWFTKNGTKANNKIPFSVEVNNSIQNSSAKNNSASSAININRSNNVTINQNQNVKSGGINNSVNRLKQTLRTLDAIESYIYYHIDFEPEQYQLLMSRAIIEIRHINDLKGRTHDLIMNTYNCYYEAGEIWKNNCPSALLSNGITNLYDDAKKRFQNETLPQLSLKWKECSGYLKKSHKYFEMEQ